MTDDVLFSPKRFASLCGSASRIAAFRFASYRIEPIPSFFSLRYASLGDVPPGSASGRIASSLSEFLGLLRHIAARGSEALRFAMHGSVGSRVASSLPEFSGLPPLRTAEPSNSGHRRASIGDDRQRIEPIPSFPTKRLATFGIATLRSDARRSAVDRPASIGFADHRNGSIQSFPLLRVGALRHDLSRSASPGTVPHRASQPHRNAPLRVALRRRATSSAVSYRIEPIPSFYGATQRAASLRSVSRRRVSARAASRRAYPEFRAASRRRAVQRIATRGFV